MQVILFADYSITIVKPATDQWRADIRRVDGRKIKTEGGGNDVYVVSMHPRFSFEECLEEAKRAIKAGGMSASTML
jgi:hypothetical protein